MIEGKKTVYQVLAEGFTANEGPSFRVEPSTRSHEAKKVLADVAGVYFMTLKDAFEARRKLLSMRGGWGEAIVVELEFKTVVEDPEPVVFNDTVKGYTPGSGA